MSGGAYYNEIDPYAARWLRNLIAAGHIAPGVVDERDIRDVCPDDLREFIQCHFFAGIGVWSYALRLAQWPDTRPVWTGSCPCQPFSVAGVGAGFGDERHLWPFFHALIEECRPAAVIGEQVASKDADPWIDLVQDDLEALGYAFGAVPFPSAGIGAPHIRDRLYWVADASSARQLSSAQRGLHRSEESAGARHGELERHRSAGRLADVDSNGCQPRGEGRSPLGHRTASESDRSAGGVGHHHHQGLQTREFETMEREGRREEGRAALQPGGALGGVADDKLQQRPEGQPGFGSANAPGGRLEGAAAVAGFRGDSDPGPTNGYWRDVDWLFCRDGKWRPVEPGTFPLAHGAAARVGRLRAYGNAINARQAQIFIECVMECQP